MYIPYLNMLLPLRAEITSLSVLLFFYIYSFLGNRVNKKAFHRICTAAVVHVVFDGIALYTINNMDGIQSFNKIMQICFYVTAIYYTYEFLSYVCILVYSSKFAIKARNICAIPILLYLLYVPFINPEYIKGNGTWYGTGRDVFITKINIRK